MAQLFVPLGGGFGKVAGSGWNTYSENLDRKGWRGAELGFLDSFADVWAAVSEAEFYDWNIGVHHPLYKDGGPMWCGFLDPDPGVRSQAVAAAVTAAQGAHQIGARYILFTEPLVDLAVWGEAQVYDWSRHVFDRLATVQEQEQIKVVLEIDGPNPYFFDGEMYTRLFEEFPALSLCVDTGRLGILAKTHGRDPLELCRRWLPWTRHMHLHTSVWDGPGQFRNHIPTTGAHTADKWPQVTPAADMARMIVAAQPACSVVLEHNPGLVSPAELEEAHAFALDLVGPGPDLLG